VIEEVFLISTQLEATNVHVGLNKGAVWSLSAAHLMNDLMTVGIVPALLPLYKESFHLSYTETGLIVLFSYFASSIMQPIFGYLTDRKPLVWLLPLGVFLSNLGLALTGVAPSFAWLLFFITLSGLGSGAFHPEASRGTHLAAGKAKGFAQAIFQVGGNAGQALGPLMLPLFLLHTGTQGLVWFTLMAIFAFFITWRLLPWYRSRIEQEQRKKRQIEGRNRTSAVILLVLVVILRSWCQIGVAGFLPFFYTHHQIPLSRAELYTFLFLGAGAVATFIGGTLSDRIGKKRLMVASMVLSIPFALIFPRVNGSLAAVTLLAFGFTVLSSFAVTVVYAQMLLPRNIGLASGLMIGFGVGAGGIGATFLGWMADQFGVPVIFNLIVILPVLASLISLWLPNDRELDLRT
jgi:FSR family fosmidomycin resistance protein-like MFS transporter